MSNTTHLVVLRYKYVEGQLNDEVALWLDPPSLGVGETDVPAPTLTTTTNNDAPEIGLLGSFSIVQSTNRTLYPGTNSGRIRLDEIRIAKTWVQALPPTPLPPTIGTLGVSNALNFSAEGREQSQAKTKQEQKNPSPSPSPRKAGARGQEEQPRTRR